MWSGLNVWEFVTLPLGTIDQYPEGEKIKECAVQRQNASAEDYKKGVRQELNVGNATCPVQPIYSHLHGCLSLC